MSLNITNLNDSIENADPNVMVYVDLQAAGTEDIIRFGIIRISQPRIGLELLIERGKATQITI